MMTEEQIVARLLAGRLDKPPAPKPPPKPEAKAQERWAQPKPREAIAQQAAVSAEAFAKVVQEDTQEARRRRQEAKELAEWNDPRHAYQRELDRFMEASRAIEADEYVMVGGFREPRYKTTCHRGKGDPDYGVY
jgi:hypothetical protein